MRRLLPVVLLAGLSIMRAGGPVSGSQSCAASGNKAIFAVGPTKVITWSVQAKGATAGSSPAGTICIGGSTVTTSSGICLSTTLGLNAYMPTAGNAAIYDLTQWYMACTNSADTVVWNYTQ